MRFNGFENVCVRLDVKPTEPGEKEESYFTHAPSECSGRRSLKATLPHISCVN